MRISKEKVEKIENGLTRISVLSRLLHICGWDKSTYVRKVEIVNAIRVVTPLINDVIVEVGGLLDSISEKKIINKGDE
jgi:hypothetical protein|tara:strand:- start:494 stop:727 length:234 start_codon:yes stop_codon:yes gene_type:complete